MTTSGPVESETNDSDTFSDDERTTSTTINTAPTNTKPDSENVDPIKSMLKGTQRSEGSVALGSSREDEEDDDNDDGEDELANSLLVSPDKLGPADRALYEKLRQQEREEREEIERELREQEQGLTLHGTSTSTSNCPGLSLSPGSTALPHSLALSQHAQQLRAREKEVHLAQERMLIKAERELDLSTTGGNGGNLGGSSSTSSSPINNSSSTSAAVRSATPNGIGNNNSIQKSSNSSSSGNITIKTGSNNNKFNNSTSHRSSSANGLSSCNTSTKSNPGGDGSTTPGSHNGDFPQPINKMNLPPTPDDFRAHLGLPGSAAAANSFLSSFPFGHPFAAAHAHLALGGHPLLGGRDIKGMMLDAGGLAGGNPLLGGGGGPHHPPHPLVNPFHPILPNHSAFPSPPSPADRYGTPGGPTNPPTSNSLHGHPPGAPSSSPPSSTRSPEVEDSMQPSPAPDDDDPNGENRSHNWTFEEQFKQLYELSEDPKRKEFLDDLFAFMQKRGCLLQRVHPQLHIIFHAGAPRVITTTSNLSSPSYTPSPHNPQFHQHPIIIQPRILYLGIARAIIEGSSHNNPVPSSGFCRAAVRCGKMDDNPCASHQNSIIRGLCSRLIICTRGRGSQCGRIHGCI
ncbi:At rich interactive domain containing protein [Plakobranchus ocellatus]|uniref:At rich interactive domain containing protein n=1 Tax=Plakobranchus ocellatus TaxID=259542 RepID=A0AAV4CQR4_9GAST|nr:At rich interactive domain containing protein [Plakobranchus ocellatus]